MPLDTPGRYVHGQELVRKLGKGCKSLADRGFDTTAVSPDTAQSRRKEQLMETGNGQEAQTTTLVLGGTGKTGRRVAQRLVARGVPTRVGSRSGELPFDWEDEATWAPALRDVESVYVSYTVPDVAVPGAVEAVGTFAELAVESEVRRLVFISGRGEEEAQRAERVVREVSEKAGAVWTIVRCAWFSQNFSESYFLEPILGGEVVLPAGDVPEPFVDA